MKKQKQKTKQKKNSEEKILFKIHWWIRVRYYYYRHIHFKTEPTASYLMVKHFRTFSGLLEFLERANEHLAIVSRHLNPFLAKVPIFYPLKTPAGTLARNGFKCLKKSTRYIEALHFYKAFCYSLRSCSFVMRKTRTSDLTYSSAALSILFWLSYKQYHLKVIFVGSKTKGGISKW